MRAEKWKAIKPKIYLVVGNAMWISSLGALQTTGSWKSLFDCVTILSLLALGMILIFEGVLMLRKTPKE